MLSPNFSRPRIFLSTLSLRRATIPYQREIDQKSNFYPRSPCGERPAVGGCYALVTAISIHALLAESDLLRRGERGGDGVFLSTLSLRRATLISTSGPQPITYFYPRSPCGERQLDINRTTETIVFLSTLSLRRATLIASGFFIGSRSQFLSTLSLRRATIKGKPASPVVSISIHALLAESDNDVF